MTSFQSIQHKKPSEFSSYILLTYQKKYKLLKKYVVAQRPKFSKRALINQQSLFSGFIGLWVYISSGQQCDFCSSHAGRMLPPVRRPFPDRRRDGDHYCAVEDTPTERRETDDYQPRAQLRKCFSESTSKCSD